MEIRNFEREAEANRRWVEILQNQLAEKEAMIDWLAAKCACNIPQYFDGFVTKEEWRRLAQEAVKNE